ncbi:MAG: ATP-dependent protease ATPase subunit HslU [Proteobacteria bacterium]|nr:ATP-dependent protease ATPase subunit HslU [Pseudomonadota bacterium]
MAHRQGAAQARGHDDRGRRGKDLHDIRHGRRARAGRRRHRDRLRRALRPLRCARSHGPHRPRRKEDRRGGDGDREQDLHLHQRPHTCCGTGPGADPMSEKNFTPREIVSELDRFIIGQGRAKRAVAIALRNRWRRRKVDAPLRDEIVPKNIIMIGSTGVGKTEIARRLARLAEAPFIKVEASKFTEVGYVGKDVESMIRELTEIAVKMVREEEGRRVKARASEQAEERLLDLLLPGQEAEPPQAPGAEESAADKRGATRERLREMLRRGELDRRSVELDGAPRAPRGPIEVVAATSLEEMSANLRDMLSNIVPSGRKRRKMKVTEALGFLADEEAGKLIDMDAVVKQAVERVEQNGIVFLDEIDKIASPRGEGRSFGPDVSREGVQRDILPIVEGSTVVTKYGVVKTDHILFIASGAFHVSKPSDLIPELQGRFPIRVELDTLTKDDFFRILTEPDNSLVKQYKAMMKTEGTQIEFDEQALREVSEIAAEVNAQLEDIGARRLHTVMEKLLEELSFTAPERSPQSVTIDRKYVSESLSDIVRDRDLSRYIL